MLIIEDDPALRRALRVSLAGEGYDVRTEADGTNVEWVVSEFQPDLAILDVRLPIGPDGYDIARSLRSIENLAVLLLSAADSPNDRLAGFDAGADDYVCKPFSMAELLKRAHALLRRSGRLAHAVRVVGDVVIDEAAGSVTRAGQTIQLTRIEFELLCVLARHPGQVLSKTQLLGLVWGPEAYNANVVEVHTCALRQKLEAHGGRVVHTVRGMGYVLRT